MEQLRTFIIENNIEIAVLTIPKSKALEVSELLSDTGVKGIWNFTNTDLHLPSNIIVENVHLSDSLMRLSYKVGRYDKEHKDE